jgi:serine/threonine protein kinase/tetratricopeptide (TPR) repeat protein
MNTSQFEPKRFGKYLLLEKVAQGGMAQLFRAKITGVQGFEKFIAIKWILPHLAAEKELVDSFIDEAKLAALLNHQNIVQIYDFGHIQDSYFISMEYLFGRDLRRISEKSKEKGLFIRTEHALHMTSRICSALDYAHKLKDYQGNLLNIIHRDVSPQNIFVTYEGEVKILDFGIAKAATQSSLTQVGMIKGKVAYMAPEQAAGKTIDHRSDIFSTGILLYEMLTNTRMFMGDTMQVLALVRDAKIPWPDTIARDLPKQILDILQRALMKEPDERYQSCGEMLADIEKCMVELSMRPTTRGIAQYMKELFNEEIAAESQVMREAAAISVGEECEPVQGEQPARKSPEKARGKGKVVVQKERIKMWFVAAIAAIRTFSGLLKERIKMRFVAAAAALLLVAGLVFVLLSEGERGKKISNEIQGSGKSPTSGKNDQVAGSEKGSSGRQKGDTGSVDEIARLLNEAKSLLETDPQGAMTRFHKVIKLDPQNVDAYSQLGLVFLKLEDYPNAMEAYQKIVELEPQNVNAYSQLGRVSLKLEDYPNAMGAYQKIAELEPQNVDAYSQLGLVFLKLEDYPKAMEAYQKTLELEPQNANAYSQVGLVYVKLEDYPKAMEAYQKAAALNSQLPDAYFGLGFVYARSKDYAKAEEMYGEAVELSPPYLDDALFNLAMVQKKQGKLNLGIENLRRTLSVNPDHRLALEYLEQWEKEQLNNLENG